MLRDFSVVHFSVSVSLIQPSFFFFFFFFFFFCFLLMLNNQRFPFIQTHTPTHTHTHTHTDTHYPDYLPPRWRFETAVKDLKALGVTTFPYINGRIFDVASDSYVKEVS